MIKSKVEFSEVSLGHLKKLDKSIQTNLVDCNNPKAYGKALIGNKKEF